MGSHEKSDPDPTQIPGFATLQIGSMLMFVIGPITVTLVVIVIQFALHGFWFDSTKNQIRIRKKYPDPKIFI